ncbi:unknown [Prevotella sp. CAG:1031]|nr:unknown [Prevotella sp. CAG:1031]
MGLRLIIDRRKLVGFQCRIPETSVGQTRCGVVITIGGNKAEKFCIVDLVAEQFPSVDEIFAVEIGVASRYHVELAVVIGS